MKNWKDLQKELLSDPETKKEYDKLTPRYNMISDLIAAKIKTKMTNKQIAEKVGTTQAVIARLESGNLNPSIDLLQKIAEAVGRKLTVHFA